MDNVNSVFVDIYEWRDKTYGNTYQAARVSVNGEWQFNLEMQYGYGDQIVYDAYKELANRGYFSYDEYRAPSYSLREQGIALYVSRRDCKKRDLPKKDGF